MSPTLPSIAATATYLIATTALWRTLAARSGATPYAAFGAGFAALLLHAWALALALHTAVGEPELAGDLAQGRAADEAMEEGPQQAGVLEPVAGGEGL